MTRLRQLSFEDPEEMPERMARFGPGFSVRPLRRGKFSASVSAARLHDVALIRSTYTESRVTNFDRVGYLCVIQAKNLPVETIAEGKVVAYRSNLACTLNPHDYQPTSRIPENGDVYVMNVFGHHLDRYAAAMLGGSEVEPLSHPNRLSLNQPSGRTYQRCVDFVWRELELDSPIFASDLAVEELEKALMTLFLLAADPRQRRAERTPPIVYLVRAVDFIMAHLSEPLSLGGIAAAAGVHAKTLQRAFHEEYGTSVMVFVRQRRLERAHDQLLAADPDVSSVTEIALANGFSHLGRFSVMYRSRYNECPSDTLRQS